MSRRKLVGGFGRNRNRSRRNHTPAFTQVATADRANAKLEHPSAEYPPLGAAWTASKAESHLLSPMVRQGSSQR